MRTTLDIDEDVLMAVKDLARAEGKTAGQLLSELARKALTTPTAPHGFTEPAATFDGDWLVLPNREGVVVTNEMVARIMEEIDLEDCEIKDFTKEVAADQ